MARLLYLVSHSTAEPARAVTALAAAVAALDAAEAEVGVWLSGEGARLAVEGVAAMLTTTGLPPASESIARLVAGGAALHCSAPCFERLGFEVDALAPGVEIVPPARLAELVTAGWTPITL